MIPKDDVKNPQELAALVQKKWQGFVNMGEALIFVLIEDENGERLTKEEIIASLRRLVSGKEFIISIKLNIVEIKINNGK